LAFDGEPGLSGVRLLAVRRQCASRCCREQAGVQQPGVNAMKKFLAIGGAIVALAVFASAADAATINMTASISRIDTRVPVISNLGTVRTSGLEMRTGPHYKKPIDSDGGGPADPPNKGSTQTTDNWSLPGTIFQENRTFHPSYPHPHYGGSTPPLACKGRPGGC
jgi:hypothetical protein